MIMVRGVGWGGANKVSTAHVSYTVYTTLSALVHVTLVWLLVLQQTCP